MTVEIVCPICGRRQTVERWLWEFSRHDQEIKPGWIQRGHPLTCGSDTCPSHTEMVLVGHE